MVLWKHIIKLPCSSEGHIYICHEFVYEKCPLSFFSFLSRIETMNLNFKHHVGNEITKHLSDNTLKEQDD